MTKTEEILQAREIKALRITIFMRVFFIIIVLVNQSWASKSRLETVLTFLLLGFTAAISGISLVLLSRKKRIHTVGITGAVLDVVNITILPIIWYLSVGGSAVPPAYMIKGPFYYVFLFLFLSMNSISIQPRFLLVNVIGGAASQVGHYLYLVMEGRTKVTSDYIAHNVGTGISPTFFFMVLFAYIVTGLAMYFFLRNVKKTIHSAVRHETQAAQLGRYFSPSVRNQIMSTERGSPIGDGIMATFGTPVPTDEDAINAVKASLRMTEALTGLNSEREKTGLARVRQGIGIHYGPAIVGNVGTEERLEYTVIGDTVNIASRLESATKELKKEIIISGDLAQLVGDTYRTTPLGDITLKGKKESIRIFTIENGA